MAAAAVYTSKLPLGLQAACHTLSFARIPLHAKVKGQGQRLGGLEQQAQLADAGITAHGWGLHIVAIGGGASLAVEFMFPGNTGVGADIFIYQVGEARTKPQAAGVYIIKINGVASGQPDGIARLPRPEVLAIEVKPGSVSNVLYIACAQMQPVIWRVAVILRLAPGGVAQV